MRLVLNHTTTALLKKTTEILLEASTKALIRIHPQRFQLQIVDASVTCTALLEILRDQMHENTFQKQHCVCFDMGSFHHYLKSLYAKSITFYQEKDKILVAPTKKIRGMERNAFTLRPYSDRTPYPILDQQKYQQFVRINMNPLEFANITLDLTAGCGNMNVAVFGNNCVKLSTKFDTGMINFTSHDFQVTQQHRKRKSCVAFYEPSDVIVNSAYVIKFLKLLCGLTAICSTLYLYIQTQKPLIVHMNLKRAATLLMSIIPCHV